ncbi:MAG: type I restriction enzyme HsdR N-terminal domain-containing protein [Leptospiraceae bacterium]|nr:type I restriction enzyme HsdR N-terminal domain-containing protein [Leptospiraceae bacterium]MCP5498489.1 type I restriction enzyme HsdR N-terminal domain-containing protein [Leptospiraceae bacterium]
MNIPIKVKERIQLGFKKFQSVIKNAKDNDVNESNTVVIITDMLSDIFGYDKYLEVTTELATKSGNYCDLAIKIDNKIKLIIEVKSIGTELKDNHIKQAVDYGVNLGVDWVVLTNGNHWLVYKVIFAKPVDKELVYDFKFLEMNLKQQSDIESLFYLSKEGLGKSTLEEFHAQRQALSRYFISQMILSNGILENLRRELRKISPGIKIEINDIKNVITEEIFKREVTENEKAEEAKKLILKVYKDIDRQKAKEQKKKGIERSDSNNSSLENNSNEINNFE